MGLSLTAYSVCIDLFKCKILSVPLLQMLCTSVVGVSKIHSAGPLHALLPFQYTRLFYLRQCNWRKLVSCAELTIMTPNHLAAQHLHAHDDCHVYTVLLRCIGCAPPKKFELILHKMPLLCV